MLGPYRQPATIEVASTDRGRDPDAVVIYALLAVIGLVRTAVAWGAHESIGAETTVALLLLVAGLAGLVGVLRR